MILLVVLNRACTSPGGVCPAGNFLSEVKKGKKLSKVDPESDSFSL